MDLVTNVKLRMLQSPVDTVVACILIRTSLSLGAGLSTSLNWRRSGGPYWVCRIAFTSVPFVVAVYTACLHGVRVSCLNGLILVAGYLLRKGQENAVRTSLHRTVT